MSRIPTLRDGRPVPYPIPGKVYRLLGWPHNYFVVATPGVSHDTGQELVIFQDANPVPLAPIRVCTLNWWLTHVEILSDRREGQGDPPPPESAAGRRTDEGEDKQAQELEIYPGSAEPADLGGHYYGLTSPRKEEQ